MRIKKILFTTILFALIISMIELVSYGAWRALLTSNRKTNIRALCGEIFEKPQKIPNTFWHHDLNPEHPNYKGKINTKGTKGSDFKIPKPDKELRIICIGDSTTEGIGQDPPQTYPFLLEEMLKPVIKESSNYESVKVINAGIGSHNSAFNLSYLAFRLLHFEPDAVIIKSTYNDYQPYCFPMKYDYTNAFPVPFHLHQSNNPYWFFARYSYLLKLYGNFFFDDEVTVPFKDFSGAITSKQLQDVDFSMNENKFNIYAENIRSMVLLCKGRDIKIFILDLPTSPNLNHFGKKKVFGLNFKKLIKRLESESKKVALEEKVPFINTAPFEKDEFWDLCHNTVKGNKKIAKKVLKTLLISNIIQ